MYRLHVRHWCRHPKMARPVCQLGISQCTQRTWRKWPDTTQVCWPLLQPENIIRYPDNPQAILKTSTEQVYKSCKKYRRYMVAGSYHVIVTLCDVTSYPPGDNIENKTSCLFSYFMFLPPVTNDAHCILPVLCFQINVSTYLPITKEVYSNSWLWVPTVRRTRGQCATSGLALSSNHRESRQRRTLMFMWAQLNFNDHTNASVQVQKANRC